MAFKPRFKNLGREYLAAIEGAIGCPVDAAIKGKTFELADLTATLRRFYDNWSPESSGLLSGSVLYTDDPEDGFRDLNSASEIEIPLRSQCKHDPGIFIMMGLRDLDRVRSLLMFADAILFWDPFEEAIRDGRSIDRGVAETGLAHLMSLRPLIKAGLVVPAQLARTRAPASDGSPTAGYASNLDRKSHV